MLNFVLKRGQTVLKGYRNVAVEKVISYDKDFGFIVTMLCLCGLVTVLVNCMAFSKPRACCERSLCLTSISETTWS